MKKPLKMPPLFIVLIAVLYAVGILFLFSGDFLIIKRQQQFVYLAQSFISGHLNFIQPVALLKTDDMSFYNGQYFWPQGIFPSIVMMPFVFIFGTGFLQGFISFFLTCANLYLLFKLARHFGVDKIKAYLLAFAYVFSTAYIMVAFASFSWYFAHVVATTCVLLAFYFTFISSKLFFAGLFFSLACLTRFSLAFGGIFFLFYYLTSDRKNWLKRLAVFAIPVVVCAGIFMAYNYVRFGNIFESGYKYQLVSLELAANRDAGMWSLKHFPTNLFIFFLKGPDFSFLPKSMILDRVFPGFLGMSFIYTSPILLYLVLADYKNKFNQIALITSVIIAFFLFGSFGLGAFQYGYRFALDFQPFLFLILFDIFKNRNFTFLTYALIVGSFLFNVFMMLAFFNVSVVIPF